jgi:hypothetical protein
MLALRRRSKANNEFIVYCVNRGYIHSFVGNYKAKSGCTQSKTRKSLSISDLPRDEWSFGG